MYFNTTFELHKKRILETLQLYKKTELGEGFSEIISSIKTYDDFRKMPLLYPKSFSNIPSDLVLASSECTKFTTSGTTGKHKTIYIPTPIMASPLDKEADQVIKNSKTAFIYAALDTKAEPFMLAHTIPSPKKA
jgi:hypothetical protein